MTEFTPEKIVLWRRILCDIDAGKCAGFDKPYKAIADALDHIETQAQEIETWKARVAELEKVLSELLQVEHDLDSISISHGSPCPGCVTEAKAVELLMKGSSNDTK